MGWPAFNIRLYLIVVMLSFGTKVQILSEGALNTMEFVVEQWIRRCYSDIHEDSVSLLLGLLRSCFYVGCTVGSVLTNFLPDFIGRRGSLLLTFTTATGAAFINFASVHLACFPLFLIGRLLTGVAFGHGLGVGTMFVNEISPLKSRGRMVGLLHSMVGVGDIIGMVVGLPELLGDTDRWAYVFPLAGVIALLPFPLILLATPETPRYLAISLRDPDAAERALRFYRPNRDGFEIKGELEAMRREAEQATNSKHRISLCSMILKPSYRRTLILATVVSTSTMLTGHVSVFSYSTGIWESTGVSHRIAQIATICTAVISPLSAAVSPMLVERCGRRPLLLGSIGFCGVCLLLFSAFSLLQLFVTSQVVTVGVLLSLGLHVLGFNLAQSPRWALPGELIPQPAKSAAIAFGDSIYWSISFLSALVYPRWLQLVGAGVSFTPFLLMTVICCVYLYVMLPETKGRTVHDIVDQLGFFHCSGGVVVADVEQPKPIAVISVDKLDTVLSPVNKC